LLVIASPQNRNCLGWAVALEKIGNPAGNPVAIRTSS